MPLSSTNLLYINLCSKNTIFNLSYSFTEILFTLLLIIYTFATTNPIYKTAIRHNLVILVCCEKISTVPVPSVSAVNTYIIFNFFLDGTKAENVV